MDKGLAIGTVFIDFSNAFDTVVHEILLAKLNHYGVCDTSLSWFRDYLCHRKQYVNINDQISDELDILCGVPQGSILGLLLFIIYINDIAECITNCSINLYADDTVLYCPGHSVQLIESFINDDLESLQL